jgi:hypothetical protein
MLNASPKRSIGESQFNAATVSARFGLKQTQIRTWDPRITLDLLCANREVDNFLRSIKYCVRKYLCEGIDAVLDGAPS